MLPRLGVTSQGLRIQREDAPVSPTWDKFRINKGNNGNHLNPSNCSRPGLHNDNFLSPTGLRNRASDPVATWKLVNNRHKASIYPAFPVGTSSYHNEVIVEGARIIKEDLQYPQFTVNPS